MICHACAHENRDAARFCDGCGTKLASTCAACGYELREGARFCDGCGVPVAGAPEPPPEETRKVVSIVFADLVGSTALQEKLDPESVRHVMSRFYDTMRSALEANGGRVEKFIGDAVVAVFGIPVVGEDDALHAVRAAGAMAGALDPLNEELEKTWGVRIGMRTGVNTGELVENKEGLLLGDPMNVAARLEQAAGNGEVLIGDATYRIVRDRVTLEAVEPLALKGKSEPVPAYRLVSLDPPAAQAAAPFVGRDDDLARLAALYDDVRNTRRARLVTIIGSPGLGKSRLAAEFAASCADALVLEALCDATGESTFAPIAEALRTAASIPDDASVDSVVAALAALLPESETDRDRVATRAASVLGAGEGGSPEEIFWSVRRVIESLARERPVVLVLDDVHWAEPMLLDLIEYLAEWIREASVLLVALARPELREARASLAETGGRAAAVILLEGLDSSATAQLARDLLGAYDLPSALVERLLESTEGNPLFLVELLRMLVDDGVLRKDGEKWVVTVDADQVDVPPTIQALLAARIERLRADERVVVERASIVGKQFYRGAVAALSPGPVASCLDGHLETLRRKDLVEPEGTYWIDEPVFRFHHVLIRDAAYRRLLKEARAELHEKFADWLERKVGELVGEHEEVIGYHLEQAHEYRRQLGPLDDQGRAIGERAAKHLAAAGRRSLERDDLTAAAGLLGRAIERSGDVDAELLVDRCEALLSMGDIQEAAPCVEQLKARAGGSLRLKAWADCFTAELAIFVDPGHLRETAERVAAAAQRFEEINDKAGAAKAHAVHARTLARLGQVAACESALDRALAAAREAQDRRRANTVLAGAPQAALWGPSPVARASGRCLDVVRVLRITTGAPAVEATALRCQAVLEAMRGRFDAARKMLDGARSTLEELGHRHGLLETELFSGLVELLAMDAVAAESHLRPARDGFVSMGAGVDAGQVAALLARALLAQGRDAEALELTLESERLAGDDLRSSIAWRAARAEALAHRGELDEALRLASEAVALAETTDALIDHADARVALASVLRMAGRTTEADVESRRATELYEQKGAVAAIELARASTRSTPLQGSTQPTGRRGGVRYAPGVSSPAAHSMWERWRNAVLARDWEAVRAGYQDTVHIVDAGGQVDEDVPAERVVRTVIETWGSRECDFDVEILATPNERISLSRRLAFGPSDDGGGPWELVHLFVGEIDHDGRLARGAFFGPDQMDDAFALLEEWTRPAFRPGVHLGPGVVAGPPTAAWEEWRRRLVARDWDGLRRLFSDDLRAEDRRSLFDRPGSHEIMQIPDAERLLAFYRDMYGDLVHDWQIDVVAADSRRSVVRLENVGRREDGGGEYQRRVGAMLEVDDDGRIARIAAFDLDELAHEVAQVGDEPARVIGRRVIQAFHARDWDLYHSLHAPDVVMVNHSKTAWTRTEGADAVTDYARALVAATPDVRWTVESRVVEGDYVLMHFAISDVAGTADPGGRTESRRWGVTCYRDGQLVHSDLFDDEDAAKARALFRELTGRGGGVRSAPGVTPGIAQSLWETWRTAVLGRDWDSLRPIYADRVRVVDGTGVVDEFQSRDELIDTHRRLWGEKDCDFDIEVLAVRSDHGFLARRIVFGGSDDEGGGPWEMEHLGVNALDDRGRLKGVAIFGADRMDDALAKLEEWTVPTFESGTFLAPGVVAGPATEIWDRWMRCFLDRDWTGLRALLRDDWTGEDRRSSIGHRDSLDVDRMVDGLAQTYGSTTGDVVRYDILAADSKRSVARIHQIGRLDENAGEFERVLGARFEVDDQGLISSGAMFDVDELPHEIALVGDEPARIGTRRVVEAINDRDWDAYRRAHASDAVFLNHMKAAWGRHEGPDAITTMMQTFRETVPNQRFSAIDVEVVGDHVLAHYAMIAPSGDGGGETEARRWSVATYSGELVSRSYSFDDDDGPKARALFLELTGRGGGVRCAPGIEAPGLVSIWERWRTAVITREWQALRELYAPVTYLLESATGVEQHLAPERVAEIFEGVWSEREYDFDIEILETKGDRFGICRRIAFGTGDEQGGPWDLTHLVVLELDESGRNVRATAFADDQMEEARAKLAEWTARTFVGGVHFAAGVEASPLTERWTELCRIILAGEWDALRSMCTSDAVFIDRRAGLQLEASIDEAISGWKAFFDPLDYDLRYDIVAADQHRLLMRVRNIGRTPEGAEFERTYVHFVHFDDEVLCERTEFIDEEELPRLLELFDADPTFKGGVFFAAGVPTDMRPIWEEFQRCMVAHDWEGVRKLQRADYVLVDRRAGLRFEANRDETLKGYETLYAGHVFDYRIDVLAADSRRCVARHQFVGRSAEGVEYDRVLGLTSEFDDQGRATRAELYDIEEMPAQIELIGDEPARVGIRRLIDAYNERDWDAYLKVLDADLVATSHMQASWGTAEGAEAFLRISRDGIEVTPGLRAGVLELEVAGDHVLWHQTIRQSDADGADAESRRWTVASFEHERLVRFDLWDDTSEAEARSHFASLTTATSSWHIHAYLERFVDAYNSRDWSVLRDIYDPDVVVRDYRPTGWGSVVGADAVLERVRALLTIAPDAHAAATHITTQGDVVLFHHETRGHLADGGGPFELDRWAVAVIRDGRTVYAEGFATEEEGRARAHFDELVRTGGVPATSSADVASADLVPGVHLAPGVIAGPETVLWAQWRRLVRANDWENLRSLHHPAYTIVDHRAGLRAETDAERLISGYRDIYGGIGRHDFRLDVLAAGYGRSVVKVHSVGRTNDGADYERTFISYIEHTDDGRAIRAEVFDAEDLAVALELAENSPKVFRPGVFRAASVVSDASASWWERAVGFAHANDWDAARATQHPDYVLIDRRAGLLAETDRDGMIEGYRQLYSTVEDESRVDVLADDGRRSVARFRSVGRTADGVEFDREFGVYSEFDGELTTRAEYFDVEELQAMIDLVRGEPKRPDWMPDDFVPGVHLADGVRYDPIVEQLRRWRDAVIAKDWDRLRDLSHPDIVFLDRRAGLRNENRGRDAVVETWRAFYEPLETDFQTDILATKPTGHVFRLRNVGRGEESGDYERVVMVYAETDRNGKWTRVESFDADDLDAAMEAFNRSRGGVRGRNPRAVQLLRKFRQSIIDHDWDALGALYREDVVYTDHRPEGILEFRGRTQVVESYRALAALEHDWDIEIVASAGGTAALFDARTFGTDSSDPWERSILALVSLDDDGLVARADIFDPEQLTDALDRLDERTGVTVFGVVARWVAAYADRDWDVWLRLFVPGAEIYDRRALGWGSFVGAEGVVERMKTALEMAPDAVLIPRDIEITPNGVRFVQKMRGHLADGGGDFELDRVLVLRMEDGHVTRAESFDSDDPHAWFGGVTCEPDVDLGPFPELFEGVRSGLVRKDWVAAISLYHPDISYVDRRPGLLFETHDREAVVASWRDAFGQGDADLDFHILETRLPRLALIRLRSIAREDDGGDAWETERVGIAEIADGMLKRAEIYEAADLDLARARLDELAAPAPFGPLANAATRAFARRIELGSAQDWDAYLALFRSDAVLEDLVRGTGMEGSGREGAIAKRQALTDVGLERTSMEPIATRGDRLALIAAQAHGGDEHAPVEVCWLMVVEVDEDGLIASSTGLDGDDLLAAMRLLNERYSATLPDDQARVYTVGQLFRDACDAHDWDSAVAVLADDFVFVDHRQASLGTISSPQAWVDSLRVQVELSPDMRRMATVVHAVGVNAIAAEYRLFGTAAAGGGDFETVYHCVSQVTGERITRTELFSVDRLDDAMVRFGEFEESRGGVRLAPGVPDGPWVERVIALRNAMRAKDWDAVAAHYAGSTWTDYRRGLGRLTGVSGDDVARVFRETFENRDADWDMEILAADPSSGTRIVRSRVFESDETTAGAWESSRIVVSESDGSGELRRAAQFDEDQLDDALALYEEWRRPD